MSTVVNTPASGSDNSGMGFLVGAILLVAVIFMFFYFGLPLLRGAAQTPQAPQIQVPNKLDVNVDTPAQ